MKVDPAGLGAAAQKIAAKSTAVAGGQSLHPPLAADSASVAAAGRLSVAGAEVMALLTAQFRALSSAASQLGISALMFDQQEQLNQAATATVSAGAGPVTVPGVALKAPQVPADVRPQFGAPAPMPGESISTLIHTGSGSDAGFAAAMDDVVVVSTDTVHAIQSVIDDLPESWDSPNAIPVAQHLSEHAEGLHLTSQWAQKLAEQARTYSDQYTQAVTDIPTPQEFAAVNAQLEQAIALNTASGGMHTALVTHLMSRKQALEALAQQGYSSYHVSTEVSTASTTDPAAIVSTAMTMALSLASGAASGLGALTGAALGLADGLTPLSPADIPGDLAQAGEEGEEGSQDGSEGESAEITSAEGDLVLAADSEELLAAEDPLLAGVGDDPLANGSTDQMASMLPMMLPTALGAASGVLGTVGKIPETLTQAATQAVTAATEGLSSALSQPSDLDVGSTDLTDVTDPGLGLDSSFPAGTGPADTTPAAGTPPLSSVAPSTGLTPSISPIPAGATAPVAGTPTHSGSMAGMGGMPFMPMSGMNGGQQGNGDKREEPNRKLVPPSVAHSEQVTGKVAAERVVVASTPETPQQTPNAAGEGPARPVARRITTPARDEP